jgi:hypothetical protein
MSNPRPSAQVGEELIADGAATRISDGRRPAALCRRQSPHRVYAAEMSTSLRPRTINHSLDLLRLKRICGVHERGGVADRHGVTSLTICRGREFPIGLARVEPPLSPAPSPNLWAVLGPDVDAVQTSPSLTKPTPIVGIDHRDLLISLSERSAVKACTDIRIGGDDLGRHHIHRAHPPALSLTIMCGSYITARCRAKSAGNRLATSRIGSARHRQPKSGRYVLGRTWRKLMSGFVEV